MNVNGFIDKYMGGARSDMYEVWIGFPEKIKNLIYTDLGATMGNALFNNPSVVDDTVKDTLTNIFDINTGGLGKYMAKSAKLPKSGTSTGEVKYKGRTFKYPTTRADEDTMPITFYNDVHFGIRNALEIWSQKMRSTQTNYGYYPKDLFGEMKIYQHDQLGNILKAYKFINIYPTEVGEIALSFDDEKLEEFASTWTYHYWITDTTK